MELNRLRAALWSKDESEEALGNGFQLQVPSEVRWFWLVLEVENFLEVIWSPTAYIKYSFLEGFRY